MAKKARKPDKRHAKKKRPKSRPKPPKPPVIERDPRVRWETQNEVEGEYIFHLHDNAPELYELLRDCSLISVQGIATTFHATPSERTENPSTRFEVRVAVEDTTISEEEWWEDFFDQMRETLLPRNEPSPDGLAYYATEVLCLDEPKRKRKPKRKPTKTKRKQSGKRKPKGKRPVRRVSGAKRKGNRAKPAKRGKKVTVKRKRGDVKSSSAKKRTLAQSKSRKRKKRK